MLDVHSDAGRNGKIEGLTRDKPRG